jgi:folylpolyglutamate synthase/dihydropteroate synthase
MWLSKTKSASRKTNLPGSLIRSPDPVIRRKIAKNATPRELDRLKRDYDITVLIEIAGNPRATAKLLDYLANANRNETKLLEAILKHEHISRTTAKSIHGFTMMMGGTEGRDHLDDMRWVHFLAETRLAEIDGKNRKWLR